jgi:hypothetical protein
VCSAKEADEVEYSAVVIEKDGRRRLYDTARDHSIRFATASGQLLVSWDVWSLGLIGNASGRNFPNEAELDARRFR